MFYIITWDIIKDIPYKRMAKEIYSQASVIENIHQSILLKSKSFGFPLENKFNCSNGNSFYRKSQLR